MEVTEEMLDCARGSDVSLIIIGRTAGEDQDNNTNPGSYCLRETEEDLICRVCEMSKCTVVVLNVGNIIDMSWVEKYHPQAVLYRILQQLREVPARDQWAAVRVLLREPDVYKRQGVT